MFRRIRHEERAGSTSLVHHPKGICCGVESHYIAVYACFGEHSFTRIMQEITCFTNVVNRILCIEISTVIIEVPEGVLSNRLGLYIASFTTVVPPL